MSNGLPDRPRTGPDFLSEHIARFGPNPPRRAPIPKPHSREGHKARSERRRPAVEFERQRRAANLKAERERILYGTKPTLEQRLAAIPPPTYTPIAPKPVLINFDKLTTADLVRIFTPKLVATLDRLDVFTTFQFAPEVPPDHIKDLRALIDRLTFLKRSLKDLGSSTSKEEFQGWNFGLKEIGSTSFKGLRRNQVRIVKELSSVWRSNYFYS